MATAARRPANKRGLTELFVRKVKPPKGRDLLVWDTHERGLALRVRASGTRSWFYVYSRSGRPRWLHLGNVDATSLGDARTAAAENRAAVRKGRDPAAEKRAERGAGTFAELAERYVEQHAKKFNRSWRQADALIARHALPRWGKLQASAVTRADVKQMMARIEAPIAANQTSPLSRRSSRGASTRSSPPPIPVAGLTAIRPTAASASWRTPKFQNSGGRSTASIRHAPPPCGRFCCSVRGPAKS